MDIIDSSMVPACREMGITPMKTSYSTNFNEALDFTCTLADAGERRDGLRLFRRGR